MNNCCCCPKPSANAAFVWNANGNLALFPVTPAPGQEIVGAFDGARTVKGRMRLTHLHLVEKRTTGNAQATLVVDLWKRSGGADTLLATLTIDQTALVDWAEASVDLGTIVESGDLLFVSFPGTSLPGAPTTAVNPDTAVLLFAERA